MESQLRNALLRRCSFAVACASASDFFASPPFPLKLAKVLVLALEVVADPPPPKLNVEGDLFGKSFFVAGGGFLAKANKDGDEPPPPLALKSTLPNIPPPPDEG